MTGAPPRGGPPSALEDFTAPQGPPPPRRTALPSGGGVLLRAALRPRGTLSAG